MVPTALDKNDNNNKIVNILNAIPFKLPLPYGRNLTNQETNKQTRQAGKQASEPIPNNN